MKSEIREKILQLISESASLKEYEGKVRQFWESCPLGCSEEDWWDAEADVLEEGLVPASWHMEDERSPW